MEIARNVLIAVARIGNKAQRSSLPAKNRGSVDVSARHLITVLTRSAPTQRERPQGHQ